jgi:hypothetical protein
VVHSVRVFGEIVGDFDSASLLGWGFILAVFETLTLDTGRANGFVRIRFAFCRDEYQVSASYCLRCFLLKLDLGFAFDGSVLEGLGTLIGAVLKLDCVLRCWRSRSATESLTLQQSLKKRSLLVRRKTFNVKYGQGACGGGRFRCSSLRSGLGLWLGGWLDDQELL